MAGAVRIAVALFALLAIGAGAEARTVQIRSGEHGNFTRLVIELGPKDGWQLGRDGANYRLRFDEADLQPDLEGVFRLIDRQRVRNIRPDPSGNGLIISVGADSHAIAFAAKGGAAVIDIYDGAPPADSPFERALGPDGADAAGRSLASRPPPRRPDAGAGGGSATISFRPEITSAASLPIYWRDILPGGAPDLPAAPRDLAASGPDGAARAAADEPPVSAGDSRLWPVPADASVAPADDHTEAIESAEAPPPPLPLGPQDTVESPTLPAMPDPMVLAMEDALRHQVARAAAQGLAEAAVEDVPDPSAHPAAATPAPEPGEANAEGHEDISPAVAEDHIAFHAETAMDRDGHESPVARHLNAIGAECPPSDDFDLMSWGTDEPPVLQLTAARAGLTGEFDRPDAEAVETLAKLYLHFGLGAEARQTLASFGFVGPTKTTLTELGYLIDDQPVPADSSLPAFAECDTALALWAFLAAPPGAEVKTANVPAIVRAFAGLPPHLRVQLGQRLSNRLIAIGALDEAKSIRNATARRAAKDDRRVEMMDAEIALGLGQTEEAQAGLSDLIAGNDALSSDALILSVRARIEAGQPVSPDEAEAIAALAFERRLGGDADDLARLEILAHASDGALDRAFERYRGWAESEPLFDPRSTGLALFKTLSKLEDDGAFLHQFFEQKDILAALHADNEVSLALAGRLAQLGFTAEVRDLLQGAVAETEAGRLALAQAALSAFDADEAIRLTEGITTEAGLTLRAEAFRRKGEHIRSAEVLEAIGQAEAAADARWRGGDVTGAAAGHEAIRTRLTNLGVGAPSTRAAEGLRPTLAESKALVEASQTFRSTLATLLANEGAASAAGTEGGAGGGTN